MQHDTQRGDQEAALAIAIGQRVRLKRQAQAWTLDRLAGEAGVSRRMLINVEQGAANPSVGTLLKISDALGIGLPALVELPEQAPVKVTRHGEGVAFWRGRYGGRAVLVAGTEPSDVFELWEWTLQPGERHDSEARTSGARDLLQVLGGAILLTVGDEDIRLNAGDAASFPGDVTHAYLNDGEVPARFMLCVLEPGVGKGGQ